MNGLKMIWIGLVVSITAIMGVVLTPLQKDTDYRVSGSPHSNPYVAITSGAELGCMAMNIYHEGRGESPRGRAAIAAVTMNRVASKHYPNTICEVVWQRKQFSWTLVSPTHHVIRDEKSWKQALLMADLFINGATISELGKATHYHAIDIEPNWMDSSRLIAQVGGHYFYTM